jgi:hypothetical protein
VLQQVRDEVCEPRERRRVGPQVAAGERQSDCGIPSITPSIAAATVPE